MPEPVKQIANWKGGFVWLEAWFTPLKLSLTVVFSMCAFFLFPWPRHRLRSALRSQLVWLVREGLNLGFEEVGELASSAVVFTERRDITGAAVLYTLLEHKPVDNASGQPCPMYPGKRVKIYERPDTSAIKYLEETLKLSPIRLSSSHHDVIAEVEYPRNVTTRAPRPFLILIEKQPQRGAKAYNYDMIYVAIYEGKDAQVLDKPPRNCEWRRVDAIRAGESADMLEDVTAVILQAAQQWQTAHLLAPTSRENSP